MLVEKETEAAWGGALSESVSALAVKVITREMSGAFESVASSGKPLT